MPLLRAISLGAGVQSTTVALMAARGLLGPLPDCAIFADTGWEPAAVYAHLDWLERQLPFPVHRVSAGDLRADTLAKSNSTGQRFASVPFFTLSPKGKAGIGRRQCTKEYKLRPIQRKVVELMGSQRPAGGCAMLIGISKDEVQRMRPSRVRYIVNEFPLLDLGLRRSDCVRWLQEECGIVAPRSACCGCPFRSNDEWRALTPAEFADTVLVDTAIRTPTGGMRGEQFMHADRVALDRVDLSTAAERGQLDLFVNECEGMCGL